MKAFLREMGLPILLGIGANVAGNELLEFHRLAAFGLGVVTLLAVWWFFTREA
jgi:hypothetical protein